MNKSATTSFLALILTLVGFFSGSSLLLTMGLFAFSGAITNWLAVHMLFEKVPGLYGSGIIPLQFETIKKAIKSLMMEQFFTKQNIDKFLTDQSTTQLSIDVAPIIESTDLYPFFFKMHVSASQ